MTLAGDIARFYGKGKEVRNGDGWLTFCNSHPNADTPAMATTDTGDGDVKVYCHAGCDFKDIKDQMRKDGLLPEWKPEPKHSSKKETKKDPEPAPEVEEKESFIWKKSSKEGLDHAKKYLEGRAITLDLPICFKWNVYKGDEMIVAAASKPGDTAVYAIQRLFIDTDNHKKTGEKMLGPCEGRGVWFNRKGDMTEIVVGEGIETTLSAMQATGKNGVAALSTSGMKALVIPEETEILYIASDSDPVRERAAVSMPGQKAAYVLAERFINSREGRQAFIVSPDDTCFSDEPAKLDFNDLLKEDPTGASIRSRFEKSFEFRALDWSPDSLDKEESEETEDEGGQFPPSTMKALAEMNKIYAAVLLGGDFRIVKEGFDLNAMKNTLSFLKMTSFYSYHANTKVQVYVGADRNVEYKEIAKVWIQWEGRRTYEDVAFDPSEQCGPLVYNLFKGFPLKPTKGDWSLIRNHIFTVICDSNAEHFEYVMAWMARAVQDPGGDKPGVAIVLKGGKGIGKGVFVNCFGAIFGEAFLPIADSESFTGRFNMHLSKSLVVFLDEAVWGGDKKAEGKLKQLITEPTILFEPKGIDSLTMRNFINVIIASNEDWVVPATGDERRFCVLQPSAAFQQNTEYFGRIIEERKNGGAEAMMFDLLKYDYSAVDLRRAPRTDGLSEQVQASLPSVLEFWHTVLERGYMLTHKDTGRPMKSSCQEEFAPKSELWPGAVFKYEVATEYSVWCKTLNERHPKNENLFWRETWKIWAGGTPKRYRKRGENSDLMEALLLPEIDEARKAFTQETCIKFDIQETDAAEPVFPPFNGEF